MYLLKLTRNILSTLTLVVVLNSCSEQPLAPEQEIKVKPENLAFDAKSLANVADKVIKDSYLEHAALARLYSWYLPYESNQFPIEHQLKILSQDVVIKSGLGTAKGHSEYQQRVSQLPKDWQNSHFVNKTDVVINDQNNINLTAQVSYFNQGMLADDEIRSAELLYNIDLNSSGHDGLPIISKVNIVQQKSGTATQYESAYHQNRLISLLHYWIALIENPNRDLEAFRAVYADDFQINFPTRSVNSFAEFADWYQTTASSVVASKHTIEFTSSYLIDENNLELYVNFHWVGILPDNSRITGRTEHKWLVIDNPTEMFAKIKRIDIKQTEPFSKVP